MGYRTSPVQPGFLSTDGQFSSNLATTRESMPPQNVSKGGFRTFPLKGYLAPETSKLNGSNRYLTHTSLQPKGCTAEKYYVLSIVIQGPESFQLSPIFCTTYGFRDSGHQSSKIFTFLPIFPIHNA